MNQKEWFARFNKALESLPSEERKRAVEYYRELYADKREEGEAEERILRDFGDPEAAAEKLKPGEEGKEDFRAPADGGQKEKPGATATAGAVARRRFPPWGIALTVAGILVVIAGIVLLLLLGSSSVHRVNARRKLSVAAKTVILEAEAGEIRVGKSDLDFPVVNFYEGSDISVEVTETGDTVYIRQKCLSRVNNPGGEIELLLLEGVIADLQISLDAGKVTLEHIVTETVNVSVDAGSIAVDGLTASTSAGLTVDMGNITGNTVTTARLDMSVDAGNIEVKMTGKKSDYDIHTEVSVGTTNVGILSNPDAAKKVTAAVDIGEINLTFAQ